MGRGSYKYGLWSCQPFRHVSAHGKKCWYLPPDAERLKTQKCRRNAKLVDPAPKGPNPSLSKVPTSTARDRIGHWTGMCQSQIKGHKAGETHASKLTWVIQHFPYYTDAQKGLLDKARATWPKGLYSSLFSPSFSLRAQVLPSFQQLNRRQTTAKHMPSFHKSPDCDLNIQMETCQMS